MKRAAILILLVLLAMPAWAAVETTTVNAKVIMANGQPATSGTVTAQLSAQGTALDGITVVAVAGRTTGTIDPNGTVTGLVLVPNDAITPTGTYYQVTFNVLTPIKTSWIVLWRVLTVPDPVNVGAVDRLDIPSTLTGMQVQQDNVTKVSQPNSLDFSGSGVTVTQVGNEAQVAITGGGGGASDRLTSVGVVAGDTMVLSTDAGPTTDILTFSRTPLKLVGTAPFTAVINDNVADLATHWQSNRGIFMSRGKAGGFLGTAGGIGAVDENGTGPEIFFSSDGAMTIARANNTGFTWTSRGNLLWSMTSAAPGIGAGLRLNQMVGLTPILDLQEAGVNRLRFDDHGVISLLNPSTFPHIASDVTFTNPGFVYSDRVASRGNDLMQFQVASAASHKEFFGFNSAGKLYVGVPGADVGAIYGTDEITIGALAKGAGTIGLRITAQGEPILFDSSGYQLGMRFQIGNGKAYLVDLDKATGANDSYFHVRKNDADSTTANDMFQIEHVNATVGGTRNLLSILVGTVKGFFIDKNWILFLRDVTAGYNMGIKFNSTRTINGSRVLTYDMPNADATLKLPLKLTNTATIDFPSALIDTCDDSATITVTGAVDTDPCVTGPGNAAMNAAGSQFTCWVSAADTITVRHCCNEGASCDPGSATFRVTVLKE